MATLVITLALFLAGSSLATASALASTTVLSTGTLAFDYTGSAAPEAREAGPSHAIELDSVSTAVTTKETASELTTGRPWHVLSLGDVNGGLSAISCFSTTSCTAVGFQESANGNTRWGLVVTLDGGRWELDQTEAADKGGQLSSISCPTTSACVAVGASDSEPYSLVLASGKWTAVPVPRPSASIQGGRLESVSCTAPKSCVAVGWGLDTANAAGTGLNVGGGEGGFAYTFNGTRWAAEDPSLGSVSYRLNAVSCTGSARRSDCTAVGALTPDDSGVPLVLRSDGGSWRQVPLPTSGPATLSSVSCTGPACTAVGNYDLNNVVSPLVLIGKDGRWSTSSAPPTSQVNFLFAVSCAGTVSWCAAAGSRFTQGFNTTGVVQLWDGRWRAQDVTSLPSSSTLGGVSCVGTATPHPECVAVGLSEGSSNGAGHPVIVDGAPTSR